LNQFFIWLVQCVILVHLNGRQRVFLPGFLFDRLQMSTSGAESSKRTQRAEFCRHIICKFLWKH